MEKKYIEGVDIQGHAFNIINKYGADTISYSRELEAYITNTLSEIECCLVISTPTIVHIQPNKLDFVSRHVKEWIYSSKNIKQDLDILKQHPFNTCSNKMIFDSMCMILLKHIDQQRIKEMNVFQKIKYVFSGNTPLHMQYSDIK